MDEGQQAEAEEQEADGEPRRGLPEPSIAVRETTAKEPTDRTDDPVRMYLREMGSVQLLSREGEVAIAKRIEASREAMIAGLCESPLTVQAIIIWRDELLAGKILLRHIIDLGATYAGPDGTVLPKSMGSAKTSRRRNGRPMATPGSARGRATTTTWRTTCRSRPWRPS